MTPVRIEPTPGKCPCGCRTQAVRNGHYLRKSDLKRVQKYQCAACGKFFSAATSSTCFGQKKRHLNWDIFRLLCSCVSMRRVALLLNTNRKTVDRKFRLMGKMALGALPLFSLDRPEIMNLQFDDMESFEHSKCKPLSITLASDQQSRRILGFRVAEMPAKGRLAKISVKKYGPRRDLRPLARVSLFTELKPLLHPDAVIWSDKNPHYKPDVKEHFPGHEHKTYKGRRGCVVGQGELKRGRYDPLFNLNHTCAMLRDNIKRLSRRTWCTTKRRESLSYGIAIYAFYHNLMLL